jgi:tricorn protease-like protein
MKTTGKVVTFLALAGIAVGTIMFMRKEDSKPAEDGFVGRSSIVIENGHMTPEALLAFGRLSDPQVSPDGRHILYGVSYTSVEDNRSVRNLYICNIDGSEEQLLTQSGKSISNARWSADGKQISFLKGGQIWIAEINQKKGK